MNATKSKPLTMEQRITVAYQHFVVGIPQDAISHKYKVNQGRVNEACTAIKLAASQPIKVRRLCKGLENGN